MICTRLKHLQRCQIKCKHKVDNRLWIHFKMIQMAQVVKNKTWFLNYNKTNSKVCFTAFINNKFKLMKNNNNSLTSNYHTPKLCSSNLIKQEASIKLFLLPIKLRRALTLKTWICSSSKILNHKHTTKIIKIGWQSSRFKLMLLIIWISNQLIFNQKVFKRRILV